MKTNSNRQNQAKSKKPKIPNQNYQTNPNKPNLLKQTYLIPNQCDKVKAPKLNS